MAETTSTLPAIKASWIFALVGVFIVFVFIATYSSRMAKDAGDYDQQRRAERLDILAKQRAGDVQALTTADWVDAAKGTVRIPIDEAIPQTVAALMVKPVQMGAEIPGAHPSSPAPAAKAAPAGSANAAPTGPATTASGTNTAPSTAVPPSPGAPNK